MKQVTSHLWFELLFRVTGQNVKIKRTFNKGCIKLPTASVKRCSKMDLICCCVMCFMMWPLATWQAARRHRQQIGKCDFFVILQFC